MSTFLCGSPSNDEHVVELLRCALVRGDQEARVRVQLCLGEVVRGWFGRHPNREALCRLDSEENYVAVTFERFWQVTNDQQIEFSTIATALHYLRVSLNGAILDRMRASSGPKEVPSPQPGSPGEPLMEDVTPNAEVWELLRSMLLNVREQRLAYLLFHCGRGRLSTVARRSSVIYTKSTVYGTPSWNDYSAMDIVRDCRQTRPRQSG